jgi:uncharacterized protein with HEPN domain
MPSNKKRPTRPDEIVAFARQWTRDIIDWTKGHSETSFFDDRMLQAATQRAFTALGEAIKDLPDHIMALEPEIPWEDIKGFRDVIAHDYWGIIERKSVWNVITTDLLPLDAALARLEERLKKS